MRTLETAHRSKKTIKALLRINQASYVRDKNTLKPISVKWDLEKQSDFFTGLLSLSDDLDLIIENLEKL